MEAKIQITKHKYEIYVLDWVVEEILEYTICRAPTMNSKSSFGGRKPQGPYFQFSSGPNKGMLLHRYLEERYKPELGSLGSLHVHHKNGYDRMCPWDIERVTPKQHFLIHHGKNELSQEIHLLAS